MAQASGQGVEHQAGQGAPASVDGRLRGAGAPCHGLHGEPGVPDLVEEIEHRVEDRLVDGCVARAAARGPTAGCMFRFSHTVSLVLYYVPARNESLEGEACDHQKRGADCVTVTSRVGSVARPGTRGRRGDACGRSRAARRECLPCDHHPAVGHRRHRRIEPVRLGHHDLRIRVRARVDGRLRRPRSQRPALQLPLRDTVACGRNGGLRARPDDARPAGRTPHAGHRRRPALRSLLRHGPHHAERGTVATRHGARFRHVGRRDARRPRPRRGLRPTRCLARRVLGASAVPALLRLLGRDATAQGDGGGVGSAHSLGEREPARPGRVAHLRSQHLVPARRQRRRTSGGHAAPGRLAAT